MIDDFEDDDYVELDGYRVDAVTDKALGLQRGPWSSRRLTWVPRSVVQSGDKIVKGETEIYVRQWFVQKEDLIT